MAPRRLYAYDLAGRLSSVTDAKGQVKNYTYNLDNTLKQKSYAHAQIPTAAVSFAYDPNYSRIASMTDGTGTSSYTYNPYSANAPPARPLARGVSRRKPARWPTPSSPTATMNLAV